MEFIWKKIKPRDYFIWATGTLLVSFSGVVVAQIIKSAGQFSVNSSLNDVLRFVFLSLGAWVLVYLGNYIALTKKAAILRNINLDLKNSIVRHNVHSLHPFTVSQTISLITNDLKLLEDNYFDVLFSVIESFSILVVSAIFMFTINPTIAVVYIIMSFLMLLPEKIYAKKLHAAGINYSNRKATYLDFLKDFLSGIQTLKHNQALNPGSRRLQQVLLNSEESQYQMTKLTNKLQFLSYVISGIDFILPFGIGLLIIVQTHVITVASLIAIFLASNQVFTPLVAIMNYRNKIETTKKIRSKIQLFFQNSDQSLNNLQISDAKIQDEIYFDQLEISNISKSFDSKKILNNFSLIVHNKERLLITGKSGAGKSTLFNILLGEIKPDAGRIRLITNGSSKEFVSHQYELFGVVHQKPYIFNTDIAYNLSLGQPISAPNMLSVLKKVHLLSELGPNPLKFHAGESGSNLSGGQIARLEIARSLLRKKPILLIDEATAALDEKNANLVRTILYSTDCTIIEIAHHFDLNGLQKNFTHVDLDNKVVKQIDN